MRKPGLPSGSSSWLTRSAVGRIAVDIHDESWWHIPRRWLGVVAEETLAGSCVQSEDLGDRPISDYVRNVLSR